MVRVVHVLGTLTSYRLADEQNAPAVRWETATGTWVGIFDRHWSDLLCRAILRVTSAFHLEVWQPDLRADRIYEHTFDDGLKHVLFPARCKGPSGGEFAADPFGVECLALFEAIERLGPDTILQLNELTNPLTEKILQHLPENHVPVVLHQYGGSTYASMARRGKRIWRRLVYLIKSIEQRRLCRHIDYMVAHTQKSREDLRQVYSGPTEISTMGLDFDYWQPGDKRIARQMLDLPNDRFVLLTASMLRPKKQIDELIRVLVKLDRRGCDFLCLVIGGGEPGYEASLKRLAEPLAARGKICFLGRVSDDVLLHAYQAADLFLSVSSGEGGPVSVMKAFACQVPVFSTDVGHVAEFMREQGAEVVVTDSPRVWAERLSRILGGERVPVMPRETVRHTYDWPVIGRRFAAVYQEVFARHGIVVDVL
jgi:glycosyltransferase involved in cell wall biosynthesis